MDGESLAWKVAGALGALWLAAVSFVVRGLAGKETVKAVADSLKQDREDLTRHTDEDTRRFEAVLARLDLLRQESADRGHALRNDLAAGRAAQDVTNLKMVGEIAELRGEMKVYAAMTANALKAQ
jgi:hypothetical protein